MGGNTYIKLMLSLLVFQRSQAGKARLHASSNSIAPIPGNTQWAGIAGLGLFNDN